MTRRLLVLAVMLCSVFIGLRAIESQDPPSRRQPLDELPRSLGEWQAQAEQHLDEQTLAVLRADDHVARRYGDSRTAVDLFIAYYSSQSNGEAIHSPMNCLPGTGWQPLERTRISIDVEGGRPIQASSTLIQKGLERRLVVYWYQSHGRSIGNEYAAKVYLVLDSIRLGRSDAALVRLIAPLEQGLAAADARARDFARTLYPFLRHHIPM
jgi:EpsI family protein